MVRGLVDLLGSFSSGSASPLITPAMGSMTRNLRPASRLTLRIALQIIVYPPTDASTLEPQVCGIVYDGDGPGLLLPGILR